MRNTINTARLEARVNPDLHAMLKRAAEIEGRTLTDFVVSAARRAAQQTLEQAELLRLSLADQQCFAEAMLNPPPANDALTRAFVRRGELSKEG